MTPLDKPSAPARKGFEANCTSRSEKTTAAPSAVAEPATVVSTKPSSAFVRPILSLVLFAVWLRLASATKCCGSRVSIALASTDKSPMRQTRGAGCGIGIIAVYFVAFFAARLCFFADDCLAPLRVAMGSRRAAEGCLDAHPIRPRGLAV